MPDDLQRTQLRWIASLPASALHAADLVLGDRALADPNLAAAINQPAQQLGSAIEQCGVQPQRLLPHLVALSAGIPEPRQLAEVALTKVADRSSARELSPRIAEAVRQVIQAFHRGFPDVLEQLELRAEPLRQQWEARGPGLLAVLRRFIDSEVIVAQAEVILVYPVIGGGGRAHVPYNAVRIEAVLADPIADLPEVLRLAWLVTQLNCDLAKFQAQLTRDQVESAAALAMIPAVLTAAEEVELARCDAATIKLALDAWRMDGHETTADFAETLRNWWETYLNSRPQWHVALAALSQMMTGYNSPISAAQGES